MQTRERANGFRVTSLFLAVSLAVLFMLAGNLARAGCNASEVIVLNNLGLSPGVIDEICRRSGDRYKVRYNRHGAVVTFIESGRVIYLGKDCDVASKTWGNGRWFKSGDSILVYAGRKKFVFSADDILMRGCSY